MTPSRTWTDRSLRARLNVPTGKVARISVANVGSRSFGLVEDASYVLLGKKRRAIRMSKYTRKSG